MALRAIVLLSLLACWLKISARDPHIAEAPPRARNAAEGARKAVFGLIGAASDGHAAPHSNVDTEDVTPTKDGFEKPNNFSAQSRFPTKYRPSVSRNPYRGGKSTMLTSSPSFKSSPVGESSPPPIAAGKGASTDEGNAKETGFLGSRILSSTSKENHTLPLEGKGASTDEGNAKETGFLGSGILSSTSKENHTLPLEGKGASADEGNAKETGFLGSRILSSTSEENRTLPLEGSLVLSRELERTIGTLSDERRGNLEQKNSSVGRGFSAQVQDVSRENSMGYDVTNRSADVSVSSVPPSRHRGEAFVTPSPGKTDGLDSRSTRHWSSRHSTTGKARRGAISGSSSFVSEATPPLEVKGQAGGSTEVPTKSQGSTVGDVKARGTEGGGGSSVVGALPSMGAKGQLTGNPPSISASQGRGETANATWEEITSEGSEDKSFVNGSTQVSTDELQNGSRTDETRKGAGRSQLGNFSWNTSIGPDHERNASRHEEEEGEEEESGSVEGEVTVPSVSTAGSEILTSGKRSEGGHLRPLSGPGERERTNSSADAYKEVRFFPLNAEGGFAVSFEGPVPAIVDLLNLTLDLGGDSGSGAIERGEEPSSGVDDVDLEDDDRPSGERVSKHDASYDDDVSGSEAASRPGEPEFGEELETEKDEKNKSLGKQDEDRGTLADGGMPVTPTRHGKHPGPVEVQVEVKEGDEASKHVHRESGVGNNSLGAEAADGSGSGTSRFGSPTWSTSSFFGGFGTALFLVGVVIALKFAKVNVYRLRDPA